MKKILFVINTLGQAGAETALVYTGEAKAEDLKDTQFWPDYTFENIRELYSRFRESRGDVSCI